MGERKEIKISLTTFCLIIAIILIVVMGGLLYRQKIELDRKIAELEDTINDLQGKFDSVSNTINDSKVDTSTGDKATGQTNNTEDKKENGADTINNRDKAIQELKKALTNKDWIKENLYLNESVFGESISKDKEQQLSFEVINNENGQAPIIVVQTAVENSVQLSIIRYKDNEVIVKKWKLQNSSRMSYEIKDDILICFWMAMGDWIYDVYKINETSEVKIEANEGNDDNYEEIYKIKKYSTQPISKELNSTNVEKYIK